ncbi:MAG: hypothetical protein ACXAD7_28805, partial [Candidatus Kariarchaeaceae archaeon]
EFYGNTIQSNGTALLLEKGDDHKFYDNVIASPKISVQIKEMSDNNEFKQNSYEGEIIGLHPFTILTGNLTLTIGEIIEVDVSVPLNYQFEGFDAASTSTDEILISHSEHLSLTIWTVAGDSNVYKEVIEVDTQPELDDPVIIALNKTEMIVEEDEVFLLSWNATDNYPEYYTIFLNGNQEERGIWDIDTINYHTALTKGVHAITLEVEDTSGNIEKSEYHVEVIDTKNPSFTQTTSNVSLTKEISSSYLLSWLARDNHPGHYEIYLQGTNTLLTNSSWKSEVEITYDLLELSNITTITLIIIIYDTSGNAATHFVSINYEPVEESTIDDTSITTISETSYSWVFLILLPLVIHLGVARFFSISSRNKKKHLTFLYKESVNIKRRH